MPLDENIESYLHVTLFNLNQIQMAQKTKGITKIL